MKNLIIALLILNPICFFSQSLFSKEELITATDNGRKWNKDIKQDSLDVVENIKKLKLLIKPINISMVKNKDSSNVSIYFLSDSEFGKIFPDDYQYTKTSIGNTFTYGVKNITESIIQIDLINNKKLNSFSNTIRHEMFHMLGFIHYNEEKDSILSIEYNLTDKDIEMIKYLYSKKFNI